LARQAGVSPDTLRHYERKGVLARPRRAANGYREYPLEALERVELIRRALSVGFTLDELARFLSVRDAGGAPCRDVRALAAAKLSDVQARMRDLKLLRDELRGTLRDWDARLSEVLPGERAGLLETLTTERASKPLLPLHHFEKLKKRRSRK
jgi:DNA-binding transcriptional MerR regulator